VNRISKQSHLQYPDTPRRLIPYDPFQRFFAQPTGNYRQGILDIPNAHSWFDVLEWTHRNDFYTFQQALDGRSGPSVRIRGQDFFLISSYDYLGLIGHPRIEKAAINAIRSFGTGTGGVRLLTGTVDLHCRLEAELAQFKGSEASATFSSGYLANIGVISALFGPGDRVLVDSKVHRSVRDGCRMAGVTTETFAHNNIESLRELLSKAPFSHRTLIVVDGVYSMDGDICPLPELIALKREYGAYLMVDEAHSFGVIGMGGRGVDQHYGLSAGEVDIWMGSLSKAIPGNGGFIAGRQDMILYLQHGAAPFMFSAALSPSSVATAREALQVLKSEPLRLSRLHDNALYLRQSLRNLGFDTGTSSSPVIPVILGTETAACAFARELFGLGILAVPVIYPAVPRGMARLRLCATAAQDKAFIDRVVDGFRTVASKLDPTAPSPA
jgi:8-amino-7-oxononanoate synthase